MPREILIVDDIAANRHILYEMLQNDYVVIEAASGEQALEILNSNQEIAAVLLDIIMPEPDGFVVLRRIRANPALRQLPVIMITGSMDEKTRIAALTLGANDFVMKPYSAEIIKHTLKNQIALVEASAAVNNLEKDPLTGIWNREAFFRRAAEMIASKPEGHFILGCMDIEGFKIINDQYGSETGNQILRIIGETLQQSCDSQGGICGHIFADHFVGLYARELEIAEKVSPNPIEARIFEQIGISLTLCVGRYIVDDKTLGIEAMYDRASIAKNTVKGRYDAHVALFDEKMLDMILREQQIVNEMKTALDERQFEVWYQPQYNHSTDARIGAEALVRWRHPQRGLIPPVEFIHIFEQNGFIYALDKFVWEEVCRALRHWSDTGREPLPISVNVSRYDLFQPELVQVLSELLRRYDLPHDLLRIEITETAFSESTAHIVSVVRELLARGFTVEIDDFGSGYSSLNTLKDVPAQIIKLDMRFLQSDEQSQRGGNIIESVVRMAKWLGMSVIAEGVETLAQANFLRSIGCSYMQGYLYAKPMPIAQYEVHCSGDGKEEHLLTLETVENLDNNAFWDPESMDTLIFNSYIGGACIYEYHNGAIELLRATEKYAQIIGSDQMTVEDALKLSWTEHLDEESHKRMISDLEESISSRHEVTNEYVFLDLPNCPHETYLRLSMRAIACAGERYLVYCTIENVTAQRQAERAAYEAAQQMQTLINDMPGGFVRLRANDNGKIIPEYYNEGFLRLTEMSSDKVESLYGANALAGVHPDDIGDVETLLSKMFADSSAHAARYRLQKGSGGYIWLNVVGRSSVDSLGNSFLNMYYSDAEKQVRQDELQKSLLDNLPCGAGVYEFIGEQMSLIYQNKSYWELVGLYEEAYPDNAPMSAVHPDDIPIIMKELQSAIGERRDVNCHIRLRHLTLGFRPVNLVGRIVFVENGGFRVYTTFMPTDTK